MLAAIALVISLLSSPILLTPLGIPFWARTAAMVFATALSGLALGRIRSWRGALRGEEIAWMALILSLGWWTLLLGGCLFFGLTGAGSPG